MTTRRSFLTLLGVLPAGTLGLPFHSVARGAGAWPQDPPAPQPQAAGSSPGVEAMNTALELLAPYAPTYRGGLSNHGPMAAEALVALGHHGRVVDWVEAYRGRLEPRAAPRRRIESSAWRDALGDRSRNRDWDAWFENELADAPWIEVVGRWVPRLAPGMAAAGLHGVIRVGHAACSLAIEDNPLRRDELARALGYWAAEYLTLPGHRSEAGNLAPAQAIQAIELLPQPLRRSRGLITTELRDLTGFEPFEGVIGLADPGSGSPNFLSELLGELAGTFTRANTNSFALLHGVTGAAAVTELLPHIEPEQQAGVLAYTWQASAGILTRYGRAEYLAGPDPVEMAKGTDELAKLAVRSGDEHTIKLAAACTREWRRHPDPRFLAAAFERTGGGR